MTPEQLKTFLSSNVLMDFSSLTPEGYPHVVPIWFEWDGTSFWMSTVSTTKKIRNLEKNPKAGFSIAHPDFPYRAVIGRGDVELSEDIGGEVIKRLCYRYLPSERAENYFTMLTQRGPRTKIKLTPKWTKSWQG